MTHLSPKWQLLNSCLIITRGISSFLCNRTQFITLVRTHLYYHSCFERGLKEFFAIYLHWFGLQWRKRKKRDELLDKENVKICLVVYMSSFRQVPAFYFEISCISHHCIFITIPQLVQLVFIIGSCLICDRLHPAHHGNRPTHCFQMLLHGDLTLPKGNVLMVWIVVDSGPVCATWPSHTALLHTERERERVREVARDQLWVVTVCSVSYPHSL